MRGCFVTIGAERGLGGSEQAPVQTGEPSNVRSVILDNTVKVVASLYMLDP